MTTERDVTRIVRSWLEEGVTRLPDRVLDSVLDQLPATPQRRSLWSAWRAQPVNTALKMAFATAAVVAIVVAGINFLPRDGGGVGGPGVVPASASPTPSPAPNLGTQVVRLTFAGTEQTFTAEISRDWDFGPNSVSGGDKPGAALVGTSIDNTFKDPCAHIERTPKVGSTVSARVAALRAIPNITATAPVQTTLGGRQATYVELRIPASLPCPAEQFYLWQDSPDADFWPLEINEVIQVWVVNVGGQAVTVAARTFSGTSDATKAELQRVLDSIKFDAAP